MMQPHAQKPDDMLRYSKAEQSERFSNMVAGGGIGNYNGANTVNERESGGLSGGWWLRSVVTRKRPKKAKKGQKRPKKAKKGQKRPKGRHNHAAYDWCPSSRKVVRFGSNQL